MFRKNVSKSLVTFSLTLLLLFILVIPAAATNNQQGNSGGGGFRALRGAEAAAFHIPEDVQQIRSENLDNYGVQAVRYQQFFNGAKVFGGQLTIYTDASGTRLAVIGAYYPDLQAGNQVSLNAGQAQAAVSSRSEAANGRFFTDLMFDPASGRYFYNVESRAFDSRWFYWVDAGSGDILNFYNGLTEGSGTGVLGDTKDLTGLTTGSSGSGFQMVSTDGRQTTYDARNRNKLPGTLATDDDDNWNSPGSTSPGQAALVDAQFYAKVTDDYYLNVHNFDWMNSYPQGMVSSAHLQRNYNNAYWNGEQMAYGDGDGTNFIEFSGDLDVVGHELSHGVTEATSNLIYQNESGALNEAFSDMMGTAIEFYYGTGNWTIGEDITVGSNGIRNMANPGEDGDPSYYADRYTGTSDNGGVHTNSGIANHWFYLLVNGGQNANSARASGTNVQGVGLTAAEQITFLGFTALPSGATFCDARAGTIAVGGSHSANVADAWDEVGVTDALCNGGGGNGALDVTVTTDKPSYVVREKVVITVNVKDGNGTAVSGAAVTVTIDTPGNFRYSGSASSGTDGNAVFNFTPNKRDGTGTFTVSATASKSGYTTGADSTTFTVQ